MDAGSGHSGLDGGLNAGGGDRAAAARPASTPPHSVVRCILWHARGSTLPGPLLTALDRPTVQWKAWDCDLLTLAELVRPNAATDPLTHDARAKVIVLVDPSRLAGLASVLDTVERYRPGTPLWVYEGGASPNLTGMSLQDVRTRFVAAETPGAAQTPNGTVSSPSAPALKVVTRSVGMIVPKPVGVSQAPSQAPQSPSRQARPASPPSLRLAGDDAPGSVQPAARRPLEDVEDGSDGPDEQSGRSGGPLLSEEEIEMLLSDPPPKGGSSPGGAKPGSSKPGSSKPGGSNRGGNVR